MCNSITQTGAHISRRFDPGMIEGHSLALATHVSQSYRLCALVASGNHNAEDALLPDLGGEGEIYINTLDTDGVSLAPGD